MQWQSSAELRSARDMNGMAAALTSFALEMLGKALELFRPDWQWHRKEKRGPGLDERCVGKEESSGGFASIGNETELLGFGRTRHCTAVESISKAEPGNGNE